MYKKHKAAVKEDKNKKQISLNETFGVSITVLCSNHGDQVFFGSEWDVKVYIFAPR